MTRYLIAAETDKNQDLIFRSSRLREVIGGSMLLSRFCHEGVPKLANHFGTQAQDWDIIVNDGGSFRLWFVRPEEAHDFISALQEMYFQTTDGSLTAAPQPEEYDETSERDFIRANRLVSEALQQAKTQSRGWNVPVHLPYMAYCASCGVGLAVEHVQVWEQKQYICQTCKNKKLEDNENYLGSEGRDTQSEFFVNSFKDAVRREHEKLVYDSLWIPNQPADAIGRYDPRNYVAYLVADGNGIGKLFGACQNAEQLRKLSEGLTDVTRRALAEPASDLQERCKEISSSGISLQVMPLILGGDDVFALLPAPFALDFARRFCLHFEAEMAKLFRKIGLPGQATTSAAVVICKANYPYKLAHKLGEDILKDAKRLARAFTERPDSAISFTLVHGGDLAAGADGNDDSYVASLQPYWAGSVATTQGKSIDSLLKQRKALDELPSKRRTELEVLYDPETLPGPGQLDSWKEGLNYLLERVDRNRQNGDLLRQAFVELGDTDLAEGYWKKLTRLRTIWGHGLPDLLAMWNFAYMLDTPISSYA